MRVFGRFVLFILLLGAIGAVGYGVWNAGYQQGLLETVGSTADVVVAPYYPGIWGFGVFGLFFKILFLFLLFGLVAKLFFGRRYWRRHYNGEGHEQYRSRMEERMTKWHDEAHGRTPRSEVDRA